MILLAKRKNIFILVCALVFIVSVYMMFLGNIPKVAEKQETNEESNEVYAGIEHLPNQSEVLGKTDADFFIDYKLERDRLRGQEADYLRELINNPNASEQSKKVAQNDLIELSKKVEKEMIAENLIKAKGFEDAILFLSEDFINIVVKSDGLQAKDIAQITDAITKSTGVGLDKITIIERK